jgi:maleate isomerase
MFEDEIPDKKIGFLSPRTVIDNHAYEFYRLAPPGVMAVMVSCGLEEFSTTEVARIFEPLEGLLDLMMERDVSIISQTGVPLPLLIGLDAHDELLEKIRAYTKLPVTSQMLNVIAGLQHIALKNVLLVNKWSDEMNGVLEAFLDRGGIGVAGVYNKSLSPREFSQIPAKDSARLAYDLGQRALEEHPEADGLFIGGGNWLSQPVCDQLERETGRPVICNSGAQMWYLLHQIDMWQPIPGHGLLLGGD